MRAVIADDLTGAAELGGIGLRYNLKVEIATEVDANTKAELLIISADTRSIKEVDAVATIKKITTQLLSLHPQLIYKKIDSVLRGHVVAELKAQMEVMQLNRALVVPANPKLERTIKNGLYYFKGQPIHLSSFANDPEFPIQNSSVTDMLLANDVTVIKQDEELPSTGIAVGEVENNNDLKAWAERIDSNIVLVGAAGFFNAVLGKMQAQGKGFENLDADTFAEPMLFVCGTTFNKSRVAIHDLKSKGGPVSYMPGNIVSAEASDDEYEVWSTQVATLLLTQGKAIIAIPESTASTEASANGLREKTACVVERVLHKLQIRELVVEGGSTAASIVRKQKFTKLIPVQELSAGVVRMRVEAVKDLHLTIKPGSYDWSPELWNF